MTFDIIEHYLGKETLLAERINTTGVPVYGAWIWSSRYSYVWNRYAAKKNLASLTKIERQEIILSIDYSIIFIVVSVDKPQIKNHTCISA